MIEKMEKRKEYYQALIEKNSAYDGIFFCRY